MPYSHPVTTVLACSKTVSKALFIRAICVKLNSVQTVAGIAQNAAKSTSHIADFK